MKDKKLKPTSSSSNDMVAPEYIEALSEIMTNHGLNKIKIQEDNLKITLKRGEVILPSSLVAPQPVMGAAMMPPASATLAADSSQASASTDVQIKSPMVGNIYLSSQPDAPPFTSVGKQVKEGDTLLIIEAMKVMNPITAPCSGTVAIIHVQNSQPVEFDEILLSIKPT